MTSPHLISAKDKYDGGGTDPPLHQKHEPFHEQEGGGGIVEQIGSPPNIPFEQKIMRGEATQ